MAGLFNDNFLSCSKCNSTLLEEKITYALDKINNNYVPVQPKKILICSNCKEEIAEFSIPNTQILLEENRIK